jgi:aldehyde:ferredoxin oxidoreductase
MGPATVREYESRAERYDQQLKTEIGRDSSGLTTEEKLQIVREYREDRYQKLIDAVYLRRGWTTRGVPKQETLQRLGIDFPDVMALVSKHGG